MEISKVGLFNFLYLLSSVVTAKKLTCGFPGTPAYGYVKPDRAAFSEGDVVFYSCRVGYILIGSPISRCTDDGSWSEDLPICDDSMTTLGVASSSPTVPGHAAELAIDRNKDTCTYLKPKKPRFWRIDIGEIRNVLSVAVTIADPDKYIKFTVFVIKIIGTDALYNRCAAFAGKFGTPTLVLSCAEGKGIEGQKVHIEDHNQTEGFFEICEVEVQVEKDTGYDCGRPSRSLYSVNYEPQNNMVEYDCIRGYELIGTQFRHCQNSGQWSGEPPKCIPIVCEDLQPLSNGETRLSHSNNGPPLEGAVAIYKCNKGYIIDGPITRDCLKDGSWSGKTPQCKVILCPIPDGKELGGAYRLLNQSNSMGSVAMLRCKGGKIEGDNPYIVCTEDGTWTESEAHCIIPARSAYERKEMPRIANQGAVIFGMVVAAIMIVVVLVAIYLYGLKRKTEKPELPSRLAGPPVPPPRPPPRAKAGSLKSAFMGLINRENSDNPEEGKAAWKTQSLPTNHANSNDVDAKYSPKRALSYGDDPAVIEVEVLPRVEGRKRKGKYSTLPEENEDVSLENVVLDMDGKGSNKVSGSSPIPPKDTAGLDYAAVDYEKKRQSRLLKEQDSVESSSSAGVSPIPADEPSKSPSPPKAATPSESEEEESEEEASSVKEADESEADRKAKEEEERKAKEEEERKAKEEEERKAKEEEEKKKKEEAPGSRRRRIRDEPAPQPEEKPVLRRFRKNY